MAQDMQHFLQTVHRQHRMAEAVIAYLRERRQLSSTLAPTPVKHAPCLCPSCRQPMRVIHWSNGYQAVDCHDPACPRWRVTLSWEEHRTLTPKQLATYHMVSTGQGAAVKPRARHKQYPTG